MESVGTVKPFYAMMLWPSPKLLLSPKLPHAVYWRAQLAGACSVPLPPTPAPMHLLYSLSHLRRNILSIAFCCFWPLRIVFSKHKVFCVPFLDWWLVHNVASSKTPTLHC